MTPLETVNSVYASFSRGDVDSIVKLVAPKASWRQPKTTPRGGDYSGPEGARNFFAKLNAAYETTVFNVKDNFASGDRVVSLGAYEGNSRKTGKHGASDFCFVWRVKDGKITEYEGFLDTASLAGTL
jgi:ketosteroid isomerase-like protein